MPTLGQLITDVKNELLGFTAEQEQFGVLQAGIDADDLTLTATPGTIDELDAGTVEIDDELIQVQSVDRSSSTLTVLPGGRGWKGTTAASHSANALINAGPRFPRVEVARRINKTIENVFPDLYAVGSTEITFTGAQTTYGLPADTGEVLAVTYKEIGPAGEWPQARRWSYSADASTGVYATGKTITIYDAWIGQPFRVTYTKPPTTLANSATDFSVTGLPATCWDAITLGAVSMMVPALALARVQQGAIEAMERATNIPPDAMTGIARTYFQLYKQRVEEEKQKLFDLRPAYIHYIP